MTLQERIYQRLTQEDALTQLLASYKERPAVFYQVAPDSASQNWGNPQYPRMDFVLDTQENPSRNTSGLLMVTVWCDKQYGAMPEDIEPIVRDLLHACFTQADEGLFVFAWVRTDAFDVKPSAEHPEQMTTGVTVTFDVMALPCQYTLYPDPIKAVNLWTKALLPDALVIGEDEIDGWYKPTRERPAIYWRHVSQQKAVQMFAGTWLDVSLEGHVYNTTAPDRLQNLMKINTAAALVGHIPMEDNSPLFIMEYRCTPHMNYLSQGQVQLKGRFGLPQPWYAAGKQSPPDPPRKE